MKYSIIIISVLISLSSFSQKMDTTFSQSGDINAITFYQLFEDLKIEKIRSFEQVKGSFIDVYYDDKQKVDYKLEYKNNKAWNGHSKTIFNTIFYKNGLVISSEKRDDQSKLQQKLFFNLENQSYKGERFESSFGDKVSINKIENYLGNKKYVIIYKNNKPYSGQEIDEYEVATYENGSKTGAYIRFIYSLEYSSDFATNSIVEKGNYKEGKKHGSISFFDEFEKLIRTCDFRGGEPFNGKVKNDNLLSTFKNGIKNGIEMYSEMDNNDTLIYTQEYSNGLLDGKCEGRYYKKYFHGKVVEFNFNGVYKQDAKFDGSFFDIKNEVLQNYVSGNKNGLFSSKDDYFVNSETYINGVLMKKRKHLKRDKEILYSCIYKNEIPYEGKVLTSFDDDIITDFSRGDRFFRERTYKNGEIVGHERWIILKGKILYPIATINIKNQKYDGLALYNLDKTASNKIQFGEITGQYKEGKPISGQFIEFIKPKKSKVYYQNSLDTRINTYENGILISTKLYEPDKLKLIDLIIE